MISTATNPFTPSSSAPNWFALRTKQRAESLVMRVLERKGWECFLPAQQYFRSQQEGDLQPLFDGIVFSRFDPCQRLSVLATPGVVGIVGNGGPSEAIADAELATLKQALATTWRRTRWPYTTDGPLARVKAGPLAGLEGIWASGAGGSFFVLSIHALRCSAAFEIDRQWVQVAA